MIEGKILFNLFIYYGQNVFFFTFQGGSKCLLFICKQYMLFCRKIIKIYLKIYTLKYSIINFNIIYLYHIIFSIIKSIKRLVVL